MLRLALVFVALAAAVSASAQKYQGRELVLADAIAGTHHSKQRGTSAEFTEYRLYRQGDDPRRIDWRLLARSDRAYIRLATDRAIMELNFFGTVALTKAVLPSMLARKSGHIVPISSVVGYVGTPLRSTYAASKHALHGFFDSLRAEVAKDGVAITIICPGYVRTNVTRRVFS